VRLILAGYYDLMQVSCSCFKQSKISVIRNHIIRLPTSDLKFLDPEPFRDTRVDLSNAKEVLALIQLIVVL